MRIDGSINPIPFQAAKAYSVPFRLAAPSSPIAPASLAADQLVAANVNTPVNFHASFSPQPSSVSAGVFQMYTRAADKMEAAVAVHVGRTLDVKG